MECIKRFFKLCANCQHFFIDNNMSSFRVHCSSIPQFRSQLVVPWKVAVGRDRINSFCYCRNPVNCILIALSVSSYRLQIRCPSKAQDMVENVVEDLSDLLKTLLRLSQTTQLRDIQNTTGNSDWGSGIWDPVLSYSNDLGTLF